MVEGSAAMTTLESLMDRAELCYERGQIKMVAGYLRELDKRTPGDEMPDNLAERFNRLAEELYDAGVEWEEEPAESDSPIVNNVCSKCGGSKFYTYANGAKGICYDCQGKGHQTETDIVRVKNYWAYRKGTQRKAAAVGQQPFPF